MRKSIGTKLVLALITVVLAVLLITPRVVGNSIKSNTVDSLLNMIPAEVGALLTIPSPTVQSGWFSSRAQVEISFEPLNALAGQPVLLTLDMDIQHGPVLFTNQGSRIGLAYADITPSISGINLSEIDPTLNIDEFESDFTLFAGFNNSLEIGTTLDDATLSNPTMSLGVTGLLGSLVLSSDQSGVSRFSIEEFYISRPIDGYDLLASGLTIETHQQNITRTISPSTMSLSIPQISSTAPLPFSIEGADIRYAIEFSDVQQTLLDVSQSIAIPAVVWDLPLQSLNWDLSLNQINAELVENYAKLIDEAQLLATNDPLVVNTQVESMSMDFAMALLKASLDFSSTLSVNAFEGDHKLELQISWQGLPNLTSIDTLEFDAAINALNVTLSIDADDNAINQSGFGEMLDQYKADGLLTTNNGRVTLVATLISGELTINDEILPLDQMFSF